MAWELTGNSGTNPATDFLGTTDRQSLVIKANATEAMRINPDSNVGIGTTSPKAKLEISGNGDPLLLINHAGASGNPAIWFQQDGATKAFLWWDQTNNRLNLGTHTANPIVSLQDNGSVALHGFVGIGTGTTRPITPLQIPLQGLQIGFSATASDNFHWTSDTVDNTRGFRLWNGNHGTGAHILTALPNGNVGIGTTRPITPLQIPLQGLQIGFSATASDNFHWTSDTVDNTRGFRLWNGNHGTGAHILTALPNGNVGIGTTRPNQKLTVAGVIESTSGGFKYPDGSVQTTATLRGPQGPQGPMGDRGPRGEPGPPGIAVRTFSVCGPNPCATACSRVVGQMTGSACQVTSDTGGCSLSGPIGSVGFCCVCTA